MEGGLCPLMRLSSPEHPSPVSLGSSWAGSQESISFPHSAWGYTPCPTPQLTWLVGKPPDPASPCCHVLPTHPVGTLYFSCPKLWCFIPLSNPNKSRDEEEWWGSGKEKQGSLDSNLALSLSIMKPTASCILLWVSVSLLTKWAF